TVDKNKYMITLSTNRPNETTVSPSGEKFGSLPTIVKTSTTNAALRFDGWFENGTLVHSEPNYTFTVIGPRTLEARYTLLHKITITSNRTNQVIVTASGDVIHGEQTTVTTSASNSMLVFDGWYEDGKLVHLDKDYTFEVTGARTLEARYNIDGGEGHCIPDVNFRNYITNSLGINIVHDTETYTDAGKTYYRPNAATKTAMSQKTEIQMVYSGSSSANMKVSNTEGIQYFTGLTKFSIRGELNFIQPYTRLDLSKNTNLSAIQSYFINIASMTDLILPREGKVTILYLFANNFPANTSTTRHDLRGVMDPSNGAKNEVYVGKQGSRSENNANAFYFRMNANELTQSRWTYLGGTTINSDVASTRSNAGARLWNQ
ncbi:MAG: InlB B-repeat-containing protein, partial [Bacteroidales bacterium]